MRPVTPDSYSPLPGHGVRILQNIADILEANLFGHNDHSVIHFDHGLTIGDDDLAVSVNAGDQYSLFQRQSGKRDSDDGLILRDVSFSLEPGRSIAIVGPSGAGKSTIVSLIQRLYDVLGGSVSVDGVDVRQLDLSWLRANIGIVTQDTYLFNGSLRENLLYAKPNASEEELIEVCKKANIYDMIRALPEGFDTLVGNRGLKLSGGERQRISIARVLLKDPALLIFDEATSALDSISEASIQKAIDPLIRTRTSILIAHRLSTILAADKILVVRDGRIVEEGTHAGLLQTGGVYSELYRTQYGKELAA